jgi:SAM-dependent methyltransferase
MARTLSHEQARRVYDRIGRGQDTQAFYEDQAVAIVLAHGGFETAERVFELGCGTGRLAERLLGSLLPPSATYRGVDLSPTMVALARARLARFGERADVARSEGGPPSDEPTAGFDRWLSHYVFDLLSVDDIAAMLREAHRMLRPGGRLCLVGLSSGIGPLSRGVARIWTGLHGWRPELVGGCRPLELLDHLSPEQWSILHHGRVAPFAVPSEAVVAERRSPS